MQPTVEDLFLRYRRGDPRALAGVFDRAAPEVWRVARYLSRSRNEADDLVQATFLAAMQSAARWRPEQPLVPWLLGILANHVRMARRRQRREVPAAAVVPRVPEDPVVAAEHAELRELLRQRIEELPETYRTVLVLQIEHGMTAAESSPGRVITDAKWIRKTPHEAPPTTGILSLYNRGDRRLWS